MQAKWEAFKELLADLTWQAWVVIGLVVTIVIGGGWTWHHHRVMNRPLLAAGTVVNDVPSAKAQIKKQAKAEWAYQIYLPDQKAIDLADGETKGGDLSVKTLRRLDQNQVAQAFRHNPTMVMKAQPRSAAVTQFTTGQLVTQSPAVLVTMKGTPVYMYMGDRPQAWKQLAAGLDPLTGKKLKPGKTLTYYNQSLDMHLKLTTKSVQAQ